MEKIIFPKPDPKKMMKAIMKIPVVGRPLRSRRHLPCSACGGAVQPLGRLPWPGSPLCSREACEYASLSKITEFFPTPYGRAIDQRIVRIFCKMLEKDRILVQRKPILEQAQILVDGYVELIAWQEAYDTYERLTFPAEYERGAITIVPPKSLDDVLVFRALSAPIPADPTRYLPLEAARMLRRVKKEGAVALEVPF